MEQILRSPVDMVNVPLFTRFLAPSKRWFSRWISEPSTVVLGTKKMTQIRFHWSDVLTGSR